MPMLSGGVRKCKHCRKDGHTAFNCPQRPRKTLQTKTRLKSGRYTAAYRRLREEFFEYHEKDVYYCFYCKHIGLDNPMPRKTTQVEHFYSKARRPDLRFEMSNLVPSCSYHNKDKGSMNGPEYLQKLDKQMEDIDGRY